MDSRFYQIPLIDFPCRILPAATPYILRNEPTGTLLCTPSESSIGDAGESVLTVEAGFNSACGGATLSAPTSEQSTSKDDPQAPGWTKRGY